MLIKNEKLFIAHFITLISTRMAWYCMPGRITPTTTDNPCDFECTFSFYKQTHTRIREIIGEALCS